MKKLQRVFGSLEFLLYLSFWLHSRQIPYNTVIELSRINPSCSFNSPATRFMAELWTWNSLPHWVQRMW